MYFDELTPFVCRTRGKLIFHHAPANNIGARGLLSFDIRAKINTGESFVSRSHALGFFLAMCCFASS